MEDTIPFHLNYNYLVLKTGEVYSIRTEKFLKPAVLGGYLVVNIKVNGKFKLLRVHRLVAKCFIENPEEKDIVNHKDGDRHNNNSDNLEWCSLKENSQHAVRSLGKFSHPRMRKEVVQLGENGEILRTFRTMKEAGKEMKISSNSIREVCVGKRNNIKGLYFKYKDEISPPENARKIPGYSRYLLTKNGKVYSKKMGIFLRPILEPSGYLCVQLYSGKSRKIFRIHKLMAITFLDLDPNSNFVVNHINCKRNDNRLSNLEVCTKKENTAHSVKHGAMGKTRKPVKRIGGNSIKIYESIQEAGRKNGVNPSDISRVCKGKRQTCGGFIWKYV